MAKSRPPTRAEKRHQDNVRDLGCLICGGLAEAHHVFTQSGGRKDHYKVIPLCHVHHRTGGRGVSFHNFWRHWESIYGTEAELLTKTEQLLNRRYAA